MADIFISYKREDKSLAEDTIHRLQEAGFTVWYDERITPHTSWDETIEAEISAAKAVVVLWSQRSVLSEWVRTEADYAKEHGKLVPVMIEPASIPLAYRRTQTVDLTNWSGDPNDRNFEKLVGWIRGLVDGSGEAPGSIGPTVSYGVPQAQKRRMGWLLPLIAVALIGGAGALYAGGIIGPGLGQNNAPDLNSPVQSAEQVATPQKGGPSPDFFEEIVRQDEPETAPPVQPVTEPEPEPLPPPPPECFNLRVTVADKDPNGNDWDVYAFGSADRPDPEVFSRTHSAVDYDCEDAFACNRDGLRNEPLQEAIFLRILDDDIGSATEPIGSGECGIPSTGCVIDQATVDVIAAPCPS